MFFPREGNYHRGADRRSAILFTARGNSNTQWNRSKRRKALKLEIPAADR